MRLINADAVEEYLYEYIDPYEVPGVLQAISKMPTLNVLDRNVGEWIPIKSRNMTEEERKEWSEKFGYDIEYNYAKMYSSLPDGDEEVIISTRWGGVYIDTFRDDNGCYFDDFDMDDVTAWLPKPKPYKKEGE